MTKNCETCGKAIQILPYQIKKGFGRFCSQQCFGKWKTKNLSGSNSSLWKGGKVERECQVCKKSFKVVPAEIRYGWGKFCSRKCKGIFASQHYSGENSPCWTGSKIKCKLCGNIFKTKACHMKLGRAKFCSRQCWIKWYHGPNNPTWKGGITLVQGTIRASIAYQRWRQSCFIRDDFTCQECQQQGGELEVHHKKHFSKLLQEAKQCLPLFSLYEAAMNYSPLWNIKNGVTLCKKCHSNKPKRFVLMG